MPSRNVFGSDRDLVEIDVAFQHFKELSDLGADLLNDPPSRS